MWWPWTLDKLTGKRNDPGPTMLHRSQILFNPVQPSLRRMVVVVDAALLTEAERSEEISYLLELLAVSPVQAHIFSEDGPPATLPRVTAAATGVQGVKDWILIVPGDSTQPASVVLFRPSDAGEVLVKLTTQSNDDLFVALSDPTVTFPSKGDVTVNDQITKDAFALIVAKAAKADFFVSNREWTIDLGRAYWGRTTVIRTDDILPIVGLYLRSQGQFILSRVPRLGAPTTAPSATSRSRSVFYWEASTILVGSVGRFKQPGTTPGLIVHAATISTLITSLMWRIDQILRSRDRLLGALAVVPQQHDPVDDVLTELDLIVLTLMGAFDSAARIAHLSLAMNANQIRKAGWQSPTWRNTVSKVSADAQALAAIANDNAPGGKLLKILTSFRNTIHADAFSAGGTIPVTGSHELQPLMRVSAILDPSADVLGLMDDLGGRDLWGVVVPSHDPEPHLHPGVFTEKLVAQALAVLNKLIESIPPRTWVKFQTVNDRTAARIRMQLAV